MYIAQLLYPLKVLGPGNRIGIWFSGCKHGCKGCSNPELWIQQKKHQLNMDDFIKLVDSIATTRDVSGFTITGGEPFLQADCLREIIPYLKSISSDILIYSGYTKNELIELGCSDILKQIAVLIDGKYIESRNTNKFLRGSDNQTIHILNNNYLEYYQNYISTNENEIQNFRTRTGFVSVGIHKSDYQQKLHEHLALKGFKTPKIIKI